MFHGGPSNSMILQKFNLKKATKNDFLVFWGQISKSFPKISRLLNFFKNVGISKIGGIYGQI